MGDAVFVVRVAWCGGWGSELGIRGARCESAHNACHLLQHIAARVRIVHYSTFRWRRFEITLWCRFEICAFTCTLSYPTASSSLTFFALFISSSAFSSSTNFTSIANSNRDSSFANNPLAIIKFSVK